MADRKALVPILLPADPVNPLEAATKQYIDKTGVAQQHLRRNSSTAGDYAWQFSGSVPYFADAASRDAAWPSPPYGSMCVVNTPSGIGILERVNSNGWQPVSIPNFSSSTERDSAFHSAAIYGSLCSITSVVQQNVGGTWYPLPGTRFADTTSRDSSSGWISPPDGAMCFVGTTLQIATGGTWYSLGSAGATTTLLSSGCQVNLRASTDGGISGKPTDAAILILPNPQSAHGSWNGSEYALIGCYPATQDTAIFNNLRVMTGIYVSWITPKSAQAESVVSEAVTTDHFDGQGIEVGAAIRLLLDRIAALEDRIAALEGA